MVHSPHLKWKVKLNALHCGIQYAVCILATVDVVACIQKMHILHRVCIHALYIIYIVYYIGLNWTPCAELNMHLDEVM